MSSTLKIILGVCAAVLIAAAIYTNVRVLKKLKESEHNLIAEVAAHHKADSLNTVYLTKIGDNDLVITDLNKKYLDSKKEITKLDSILKSKIDVIDVDVPFDSSYAYLSRKYPALTAKIYNFDGMQVKQFHKLDVSLLYSNLKVANLTDLLFQCDSLGSAKSKQIGLYTQLYNNCVVENSLYKTDYSNCLYDYDKIRTELDKTKTRLANRTWLIGGTATAAIIYGVVRIFVLKK
jgi:hypothetical protein